MCRRNCDSCQRPEHLCWSECDECGIEVHNDDDLHCNGKVFCCEYCLKKYAEKTDGYVSLKSPKFWDDLQLVMGWSNEEKELKYNWNF